MGVSPSPYAIEVVRALLQLIVLSVGGFLVTAKVEAYRARLAVKNKRVELCIQAIAEVLSSITQLDSEYVGVRTRRILDPHPDDAEQRQKRLEADDHRLVVAHEALSSSLRKNGPHLGEVLTAELTALYHLHLGGWSESANAAQWRTAATECRRDMDFYLGLAFEKGAARPATTARDGLTRALEELVAQDLRAAKPLREV
jgi:hypothetical protein